jgi:hypothetical protein
MYMVIFVLAFILSHLLYYTHLKSRSILGNTPIAPTKHSGLGWLSSAGGGQSGAEGRGGRATTGHERTRGGRLDHEGMAEA